MADISSVALNVLKKCNPDPSKAGKTLLVLNALGMGFAAASNTFAAATDKNTSAKDKKFLVPAGAVTGVANIGIYFAMTKRIIEWLQGDKKFNGRGVADKAIDLMKRNKSFDKYAKQFIDKKIANAVKKHKPQEYIDSMKATFKNETGELSDYAKNYFKGQIKSGFGVLGAFAGAVIGCAILTPIIRDVSAYFVQKRMEKNNPDMLNKPYMPYFDPSHIGPGRYGRMTKQPLSMSNYMAFTHGRTRI